jgi:hypothetical protein
MALAVEPQPHLHGAASERPNRPASKNVAVVIGRLDTREASEAARRRHLLDIARPRPFQSVRGQVCCQRLRTLFENVDKHRLETRDPLGDILLAGLPHPGLSDLDVLAVERYSAVTSVTPPQKLLMATKRVS